jgi:hypothetical protein
MIASKNFPRNIMPQIRKGDLLNSPFEFEKSKALVTTIMPVQTQRVEGLHVRAKEAFSTGSIRPIIIDKNNYIVNGHHRYDIAKELGLTKVKVLKVQSTIEELIEYYYGKKNDS